MTYLDASHMRAIDEAAERADKLNQARQHHPEWFAELKAHDFTDSQAAELVAIRSTQEGQA